MRVLVVENTPKGPIGLFGEWLERQGAVLTVVPKDGLPETADGFDLVVVLGSPSGAYEAHEWIGRQRDFLAREIAADKPVVGICFGAQIIADATGGRAEKMDGPPHIGWLPVEEVTDPVWAGPWPRWHGDHLIPPDGAEVFARSRGTVQAFQVRRAVGVQFHPEMDEAMNDSVAALVPEWVAAGGTDAATISRDSRRHVRENAAAREALFAELLRRATNPAP